MRKVAIIQSNYLPWKGYFDIINDVDLFIFLDDVQFTYRDWRNRNKIKTKDGLLWLTIPLGKKVDQLIYEVRIDDHRWASEHWKSITQWYHNAPYFNLFKEFMEYIYLDKRWHNLSELNQNLIKTIATEYLGITTIFNDSRSYEVGGTNMERLLNILNKAGSTYYLSGSSAKSYINESCFKEAGIELEYKDYSGYPDYPQFFPPFSHQVSILDLLFQTGPDAPYYIWGWRQGKSSNLSKEFQIV